MGRPYIPKKVRDQVKAKFDGRCGYCGEKHDRLQIDHIKPISPGWYAKSENVHDIENLMPACASCNNYKFCHTLERFRQYIQDSVNMAEQYSVNYRFAKRYGLVAERRSPVLFYFEKVKKETPDSKSLERNSESGVS